MKFNIILIWLRKYISYTIIIIRKQNKYLVHGLTRMERSIVMLFRRAT